MILMKPRSFVFLNNSKSWPILLFVSPAVVPEPDKINPVIRAIILKTKNIIEAIDIFILLYMLFY